MVTFEVSRETPVEMSVESVKMVNAPVDLSNYYTRPETDEAISKAVEEIELTPGPQGEPGPQGPQGEKGDTGKDAFPVIDSKSGMIVTTADAANANILDVTVNDGTAVELVKLIGKNFFHMDYDKPVSNIGVTVTWDAETQELVLNGTTTAPGDIKIVDPLNIDWLPGEKYTISVLHTGGSAVLATGTGATTYAWGIFQSNAAKYFRGATGNYDFVEVYSVTNNAFALDAGRYYIFYFQCWRPGTVFDNYSVKIQIERGNTGSDWDPYREETVSLADAQSLVLQKGYNNIMAVPSADITVDYVADTKLYIDNKFKTLQDAMNA